MKGLKIKQILVEMDITQADMAEVLRMSPQNFGSKLKSDDVSSGFLESIARALEKPIWWMYGETHDEETGEVDLTKTIPTAELKSVISIDDYRAVVEENGALKAKLGELYDKLGI